MFVRQRGPASSLFGWPPALLIARLRLKRSLIGPSACLTIGPALCSAGRSNRSFSLGNNTHLFFSVLRPGFFSPFTTNLFRLSPPPCFFNRAHSPCVLGSLHAGVIGGLCRRAALPVRTLPPAGSARHSALLFHPSALRPSAWSRSHPSARMPTPPMVLFFERQLHAILSARAPVFMLNKQEPLAALYFNRVTSKFSPTPSARKPISPLGFERLPRVNSSARAPVPVPNKQEFLVVFGSL